MYLLVQAYEPNNHCQQNASVLRASHGKLVLLAVKFKLLYLNKKETNKQKKQTDDENNVNMLVTFKKNTH